MEFHAQEPMTPALLRTAYNVVYRTQFRRYRIIGWLVIACCVVATALAYAEAGLEGLSILAFFAAPLFVSVVLLLAPSGTHGQIRQKLLPSGAEVWQYTVTPEAITERTHQYTTVWPWTTVKTVVGTPDRWIVVMRPGAAVTLPRAGFEPTAAVAVAGLLAPYVSAGKQRE